MALEDPREVLKRRRRKRVLLALALLVLLPLLLVGGALLFVEGPAGEALLKQKMLAAVGDALAGRVEAEGFELSGGHLVITGLKLFTPEGELVASIDRLEADVALTALASERVHLRQVKVQRPKLWLKEDERGWNLLRAIAAKTPSAPSTGPATRNGWRVELDALELLDGLLDLQQPDRRVTATALSATGAAQVKLDPLEVTGALKLETALTAPLEERLVATLNASAEGGPQRYDVAATLGETRLRGRVELPALQLTLDELVAAPREVKAFVPGYPLLPTVYGKGAVSLKQGTVQLRAGRAQLTAEAKYDLEHTRVDAFTVRATEVDLQELVGAESPSRLALDADGALSDWRPDTLTGEVKANATWDTKGERLADLSLQATATGGVANVERLNARVPGGRLSAHGTASPKKLDVFATLVAEDLRATDAALKRFARVDTGGLGGNGTLRVSLTGEPKHPAAKALGRLQRLSIAGVQVDQLDVDADVPDVTKPLDTDILLHAKRVRVGERAFDEVTFDFYTHGREVDLDLATRGLGDLRAHLIGTLDADKLGADIKSAELTWTDALWKLEAPTRLDWGEGFELHPLVLADGERRLAARVKLARNALDASVQAQRLDLARLPKILSPEAWALGGTLDTLDVTATGKLSAPSVAFAAKLHDGQVLGITRLELDAQGTWKDQRAVGTVRLGSDTGRLDGTFDVPVLALLDEKPGDARAHFTFAEVSTEALERHLRQPLPLKGVLTGALDVSGTGEHPVVKLELDAKELTSDTLSLRDVVLELATAEDRTLGAKLQLSTLGGRHTVTLGTPLTLKSLRHAPPDARALRTLPVTLTLDVKDVQLKQLAEVADVHDDELAGALSLSGTLTGSALAPVGELAMSVTQAVYPPLRGADVHLTLRADDAQTRLSGAASVAGKPALEVSAAVAAAPAKVMAALLAEGGSVDAAIDAVKDAKLETLVVMKPFDVGLAFPAAQGEKPPGGLLAATFEASGTLEAPTARVFGSLGELRFDRVALGSARFDLKSTGTAQSFTVALGGQGRDDFKARGTTGLDVRLSALRKGLQWKQAALDLSLEARHFDLGFLSGSTELLRVVAGKLDLAGRVTGTLGAPGFVGDATLSQGRLALAGNGDYRDVELQVHATNDVVDVKKLSANSGAGKAELVARAVRQPSGAFVLTSAGTTEKFPIVNDDQLLATLSLKYQLEGDVTSALADIHSLSLPRVDVQLPEVKRKDLQDLQRPKDIIVLRNGSRATRRVRQAAKDASTAEPSPGFVVRAVVDAPRNLWVRSSDLNVELGLSEGFRVEYSDGTRLFGEAKLMQGTINVIGREFAVQKGSEARFAGPATQPYVNVSALHTNTREQVKITVTVTGKGTDVAIKAASEPPMPESDIYAILATGRRTLKNGGGASISPGQAASVVGQLAASQLKNVIAKKLPLDLFNFETSDDFQRVKFDIGWYLTDTLFLGGSAHIGAQRERGENVFSSRLEFQMTRSITLEAYAGDAPSFGADAVWSRDF
jgi:translocation and assembly module TamB